MSAPLNLPVRNAPVSIESMLGNARTVYARGRLGEAEQFYLQILRQQPRHRTALSELMRILKGRGDSRRAEQVLQFVTRADPGSATLQKFCGDVYRHFGMTTRALGHYRRALRLNAGYPEAHLDLGATLAMQGQVERACRHYRKALELRPEFPEAQVNLGICLTQLGRPDAALPYLEQARRQRADFFEAELACGQALAALGRPAEALPALQAAVKLRPGVAGAWNSLGMALRAAGHADAAIDCFREALRLDPDHADAMTGLAAVLLQTGRDGEMAEALLKRNLELRPRDAQAHYAWGFRLDQTGRKPEARECYREALALDPTHVGARWGLATAWLDVLYDSEQDIDRSRRRYEHALQELPRHVDCRNPVAAASAERAIIGHLNFLLPYQGRNDKALQQQYGGLVSRVMASRYPLYADTPPAVAPTKDERIRVGFVSAFFYDHSNWKVPIRGWVENMDRERFDLYGYFTQVRADAATERARAAFDHFVPWQGFEKMAATIRAHRLHVLIYPELGMFGTTVQLAALRLAPVQCCSWGHPQTSGLPTMDYFLSSDAMEPEDADAHYSETLVRLPGLSIHYTPVDTLPAAIDRGAFELSDDDTVYLCTQSLFKYLPRYDSLFPAIARAVPNARFVFIAFRGAPQVTEAFRRRLARAFSAADIDMERHVRILPPQTPDRYQALNRIADLYLDSIGWSGCNTALEAIGHGVPVITADLAGGPMRARHCRAFLAAMNMREQIAETRDEYVRLAIRAGLDRGWRDDARRRTLERRDRLYRNTDCVRGLEQFLLTTVTGQSMETSPTILSETT